MDEKEKTAYHEAGHCLKAFRESALAFRTSCIHQDANGEWWGETNFRRSWVSELGRACTAVVGFLAEAKAIASEHVPRNIFSNVVIRNRILQLIEEELPKAEAEQDEHVWPLDVPVEGAPAVEANFTRPDMNEIPPAYRTEAGLDGILEEAVEFVNNPVHWAAIKHIAMELNTFAPMCLKGFRVYQLMRDATEDMLAEED